MVGVEIYYIVCIPDYIIKPITWLVISRPSTQMNRKIEYAVHNINLARVHPCPIVYTSVSNLFRVD